MSDEKRSARTQKTLADWGKHVLRPTREKSGLTRRQLAQTTGTAESTLRNIETGRHSPSARVLRQVCPVLELVNPLAVQDSLTVEIGELAPDRALDLLAGALALLVQSRASLPDGRPNGVDGIIQDMEWAAEECDAAALLTAINAQRNPRR